MEKSTRNTSGNAPKKVPVGLIAGLIAAAVIVAAAGGYFGLCSWVKGNGCLLPGTVAVDDQGKAVADLGKLAREDALSVVSQEMEQRLGDRKLTLLYGENKRVELTGGLMTCSPEAAVDAGMNAKEAKPLWKLGALWLGLARESTDLPLSAAAFTAEGETQVRQLLKSISDELYVEPVDFTYELGEETVEVTPGSDGQMLDTDALFAAVENALIRGETELRIEPETVPSAELSGQVLSELIRVEPQPAGVDANGKLTPAVIGLSVNAEEAQSILDAAEPGQPVTIPLEYTPPGVSADESMYYKDLLASVTTSLDGVANRSYNVDRAASSCNGTVIAPGDTFSYLGTIGSPGIENGYLMSTGYAGGQTVDMEGGGVCQVSSSLYYCAVYSNLDIVYRANHSFTVTYLPTGLDATVYYPGLDFKFRNNTGFPIKIVAYTEGGASGSLTVQFYGSNPNGIKVETERNTLSTTAWTTVYEPDESVPQGTTTVSVTPYTGYSVEVYRCVYDANGRLISRTFENRSSYAKRDRVILYNPADDGPWGEGVPSVSEPPATESPEVTDPPVTDPPEVTDSPEVTDPPEATDPPAETDSPFIDLPGGGQEA